MYGQVPKLIKLVLHINGFDTFFSLKGLRYDNKAEFFESLEQTVLEFISFGDRSNEHLELQREITANHQRAENFKIRPGHRNLILNLMAEIEKTNELVSQCTPKTSFVTEHPHENQLYQEISHEVDQEYDADDSQGENVAVERVAEDQYILEEYLVEQVAESDDPTEAELWDLNRDIKSRKVRESLSDKKKARRPDHMYNDEFLATNANPRKRRVKKYYEDSDEGVKQRFVDMLSQSVECILPRDQYEKFRDVELDVKKMKENSWTAACPICKFLVRLPIVYENDGRYINYKRSNFERHLRFKHCV